MIPKHGRETLTGNLSEIQTRRDQLAGVEARLKHPTHAAQSTRIRKRGLGMSCLHRKPTTNEIDRGCPMEVQRMVVKREIRERTERLDLSRYSLFADISLQTIVGQTFVGQTSFHTVYALVDRSGNFCRRFTAGNCEYLCGGDG